MKYTIVVKLDDDNMDIHMEDRLTSVREAIMETFNVGKREVKIIKVEQIKGGDKK